MQPRVQVDIGQILGLLGGEEVSGATRAGHSIQLVVRASRRGSTDGCSYRVTLTDTSATSSGRF